MVDRLMELAERVEKLGNSRLATAHGNMTETSVDLQYIEWGLACLDLADRLRALASKEGQSNV